MTYVKRILCLANSWKHGDSTCVAGVAIDGEGRPGEWIRPVSSPDGGAISLGHRTYSDGSTLRVLDVVDIPFERPVPVRHQIENHLIALRARWTLHSRATVEHVQRLAPQYNSPIWWSHSYSDRIPDCELDNIKYSLLLNSPGQLTIRTGIQENVYGNKKRRTYAIFEDGGRRHVLTITDLQFDQIAARLGDGEHQMPDDTVLCISLGEAFEGMYAARAAYKLVAAVFQPTEVG